MTRSLQSFIADRWIGSRPGSPLASAINGELVATTHAATIDFGEAMAHARQVGVPSLLSLDFQQRAARLGIMFAEPSLADDRL